MRRLAAALLLMLPLAAALSLGGARPAQAGVGQPMPLGPYSTWVFTGDCNDCTGTGVGTLVLSDYTPGDALTMGNFYSFSYASNLLTLFADYNNIAFLTGTLGPGDGPFEVDFELGNVSYVLEGEELTGGYFSFRSRDFGELGSNWRLGFPDADNGPTHSWALSVDPERVPEPASLALLGAGLLGLGALRRRRAG